MRRCWRPPDSQRMAWKALAFLRPSCWARGRGCLVAGNLPSMVSYSIGPFADMLAPSPAVLPAHCLWSMPTAGASCSLPDAKS